MKNLHEKGEKGWLGAAKCQREKLETTELSDNDCSLSERTRRRLVQLVNATISSVLVKERHCDSSGPIDRQMLEVMMNDMILRGASGCRYCSCH